MPTNFDLAPPPKTVDGLACVPVDISSIDAVFIFDGAANTASADATITYTVGPDGGNPVFDLRQSIAQAWLDGAPFPPAKLAHHPFGSGSFTDLRVIESVQAAGSVHTLREQYPLALPDAQLGGGYLPALEWLPGPRLRFVFGLSDLNRARYAEAWLPANLLFDQYAITLELQVTGTMAPHAVITNGAVTVLGANHWKLVFPDRFTALSPLLEVRAADTLTQQTGSVVLPVSGANVTIEVWKPVDSMVDLGAQITVLQGLLAANETAYGAYAHGGRFVAFFNGGGMEYEGGTTTAVGDALAHETFHSWFARGIKPASQADGWWDEAFTTFHDAGADDAEPFDFSDPPAVLCTRDPWQRHTLNVYDQGARFWRGMAALIGIAPLNEGMAAAYQRWKGRPVSTAMLEESLLCSSGTVQVVDAFHRFVYGLADPSPAPDLWLRDASADPGADGWEGAFWDSPDLWIRNADDSGTGHQEPEYGQDNWFHARVRNRGQGACSHFVVTFRARGFAGTEFVYPADFLPCTGAAAGFDLAPGDTRVVKARWPRALVPPEGTHTCLLASVLARGDHPVAGRHVWEHNNLAQKNLTVADMLPDEFLIVPVVLGNWVSGPGSGFELEVWGGEAAGLAVGLVHRSRDFFRAAKVEVRPLAVVPADFASNAGGAARLDCSGAVGTPARPGMMTAHTPERLLRRYPQAWEAVFPPDAAARIAVEIPLASQRVMGLRVAAGPRARPGRSVKVHLVQRNAATGRVVGGVAVQVNVRSDTDRR